MDLSSISNFITNFLSQGQAGTPPLHAGLSQDGGYAGAGIPGIQATAPDDPNVTPANPNVQSDAADPDRYDQGTTPVDGSDYGPKARAEQAAMAKRVILSSSGGGIAGTQVANNSGGPTDLTTLINGLNAALQPVAQQSTSGQPAGAGGQPSTYGQGQGAAQMNASAPPPASANQGQPATPKTSPSGATDDDGNPASLGYLLKKLNAADQAAQAKLATNEAERHKILDQMQNQGGPEKAEGLTLPKLGVGVLAQLIASAMGDRGDVSRGYLQGLNQQQGLQQQQNDKEAQAQQDMLRTLLQSNQYEDQQTQAGLNRNQEARTAAVNADNSFNYKQAQLQGKATDEEQKIANSLTDTRRRFTDTDIKNAYDRINQVRAQAGLTPYDAPTVQSAIDQRHGIETGIDNAKSAGKVFDTVRGMISSGVPITREIAGKLLTSSINNMKGFGDFDTHAQAYNDLINNLGDYTPSELKTADYNKLAEATQDDRIKQAALTTQKMQSEIDKNEAMATRAKNMASTGAHPGGKAGGLTPDYKMLDNLDKSLASRIGDLEKDKINNRLSASDSAILDTLRHSRDQIIAKKAALGNTFSYDPNGNTVTPTPQPQMNQAQMQKYIAGARARGWTDAQIKQRLAQLGG